MHFLARALDWVGGVLFGVRTPNGHSRTCAVPFTPNQHQHQQHWPSPEVKGGCRRLARVRHAAWARATEPPARLGDPRALVPLYVLSPAEREQALSLPAGTVREVLR
jgi:hypothetical protein